MDTHTFELAQDFIWRNARLVDRHLFSFLFCQGPKMPVIQALKAYQNADGGIGNAIEADNRAPASQPISAESALRYLSIIDALDDPQIHREMLLPLCDWLQTVTTDEGGVPFVLPTANPYPHTPWMGTAVEQPPAALNPTASLVGYLLKGGVQHPWLQVAAKYCWHIIEQNPPDEYHSMITELLFLQNAPDQTRAASHLVRLVERARQPGLVETNPDAGGYVHMPLDWAAHPSSPFGPLFDQPTLSLHLARLAKRQRPDGGWPITWDTVSPAAEMEWRGLITIDALSVLRAYEKAGISPVPE